MAMEHLGRGLCAGLTLGVLGCAADSTSRVRVHFAVLLHTEEAPLRAGDYTVDLDEGSSTLVLCHGTDTYRLRAEKRVSKAQVSQRQTELLKVEGERRYLLLLRSPPADEWVAGLSEEPRPLRL